MEKFAFVPFLIMPVLLSILFLFEPLQKDIFVSSEGEETFGTPLFFGSFPFSSPASIAPYVLV